MMSKSEIYNMYEVVLQEDYDKPFPTSFSAEDKDDFYQLKFKALNTKLKDFHEE